MEIEQLLTSMEAWRASDLFVTVGRVPAVRVDGRVRTIDAEAVTEEQMKAFLKRLTPLQAKRLEETGDLDAGASIGATRYRFNLGRQQGQLSLVARALPSGDLHLAQLGLPAAVGRMADLARGMVLVTGATGSGKSTTLAAMVNRINQSRRAHVVTIEDPIEFVHQDKASRITQREVGADTRSFAEALRHVLRQSPDVILIGEMRDLDTIRVAIQASLTGHLVLATLHTVDAAQTLQRILAYYPEHQREQAASDLSMSLRGIVAQRLVARSDQDGRVAAVEFLEVDGPASRLIREQRVEDIGDLLKGSRGDTAQTFTRSLLNLYRAGVIDVETGRAHATNPDEFNLGVQGMEVGATTQGEDQGPSSAPELDLRALLRLSVERDASDLHLTVGRPPILRVQGGLTDLGMAPLSVSDMRTLLYSILTQRQRSTYELERELDFALAIEGGRRFRVNAYHQRGLMAAALRLIPSEVPKSESLHLPHQVLELGNRSKGLLLVVGPTGSGKSTTLACLLDRINATRACRIITVEDPIEYIHRDRMATVDQREVHADTHSFAAALKFILRQDPDVVLVGEMRDLETIHAAITAAETGHLVLATLHTNDAISSVDRIVDAFPSAQQAQVRTQLASALLGVVSQRLLPSVDGTQRLPAFEVIVATTAIRTLIRDDKLHQAQTHIEASAGEGMLTMDASLEALVATGQVSAEEAMRHVRDPSRIKRGMDSAARMAESSSDLLAPSTPQVPGTSAGSSAGSAASPDGSQGTATETSTPKRPRPPWERKPTR